MDPKNRTIIQYVEGRPEAPVALLTLRKQSVRIDIALLRAKCEALVKEGYLKAAARDGNQQLKSVLIGAKTLPAKAEDPLKAATRMLKVDDVIMRLQYRIDVCRREGLSQKAERYRDTLLPLIEQEFPEGAPDDLGRFMAELTAEDHDGPSVRQRLAAGKVDAPEERFKVRSPAKHRATGVVQKPSRSRHGKAKT